MEDARSWRRNKYISNVPSSNAFELELRLCLRGGENMKTNKRYLVLATTLGFLFVVQSALGHVRISPGESSTGASETYTMRVPTERDSATVRIEAEFPMGVTVSDFAAKAGWTIETTTNDEGYVVRAVWSDGSIPPGQAEEFNFTARNPGEATTLVWKVIQVHADGTTAEWVGERGSRNPAPAVVISGN